MQRFIRSEALLGEEGIKKLENASIVLFGIGGVGGHVLETLIRCAVKNLILVDFDHIYETNLNRQIITDETNIGQLKIDAAKRRSLAINNECKISGYSIRIDKEDDLYFLNDQKIDYMIDAIDGFEGKIAIIKYAAKRNIPVISSMGMGNKIDPAKLKVTDISKTEMCPLAKKVRTRLRKEGIKKLKVVYSSEEPIRHDYPFIGSVSFIPSIAGILIGSEVIKDIIKDKGDVRNDR